MAINTMRIQAILFDYGNTLIPYGRQQVEACDAALAGRLAELFGPVDLAALARVHEEDRLTPYQNGLAELDLDEMTGRLVRELYGPEWKQGRGRVSADDAIAQLRQVRFDAVVRAIKAPDDIYPLLSALKRRFKLGLVSNYPDGGAIRASLDRLELTPYFGSVVISADVGWVKPHPRPFEQCLEQLGIIPKQAVYVGDNWLADVQGAKRLGMQMIRTIQYEAPERFDPQPGDFEPDAVIQHITELQPLLM